MPEVQRSPSRMSIFLLAALATFYLLCVYLLGPLAFEFTADGLLGYRAAPNQIVRPEAHEVV